MLIPFAVLSQVIYFCSMVLEYTLEEIDRVASNSSIRLPFHIAMSGQMGSGKTTLVQAIVSQLEVMNRE